MKYKLIGREKEQNKLKNLFNEGERGEMIAIIGRRGLGKTRLVKDTFGKDVVYQLTGQSHQTKQEQLLNFSQQFKMLTDEKFETPNNWLEGFFC